MVPKAVRDPLSLKLLKSDHFSLVQRDPRPPVAQSLSYHGFTLAEGRSRDLVLLTIDSKLRK